MQRDRLDLDLGHIIERLATVSNRPRYALLLLELIIEAADANGKAGPFLNDADGQRVTVREWLCRRLAPLSARSDRRGRAAGRLGDDDHAVAAINEKEKTHSTAATNVSRAVGDLVRAGLVERHYAGYATPHENRGGGRHAVYTLAPLMRKPARERLPDQSIFQFAA